MVIAQKVTKMVAIYVRKSRLKDADSMEIDRQLELLVDYAEANNMEYQIFSEAGSSEDWEGRSELQRMLMELKRNIYDGVLVTDQDRLTRDRTDFGLFVRFMKNEGLQLFTLSKTYNFMNDDDIFTSGIQSEMDNHFMRMTKRKLYRGRIQAIKKGVFFPSAPFGYTKTPEKYLIPHPEESKIVEEIFYKYVEEDKNPATISEELRLRGVLTKKGTPFLPTTVKYILSNMVYRGVVHYSPESADSIVVEEAHPALVTSELFYKAQVKSDTNVRSHKGEKKAKHTLSHLLYCPKCGQMLSVTLLYATRAERASKIKENRIVHVINCKSSMDYVAKIKLPTEKKCDNKGVRGHRVEEAIMADLKLKLMDVEDEINAIIKGDTSFIKEVASKQQELTLRYNKLEEQKKKVQEGYKLGIYDADEVMTEIKDIKDLQNKVQHELKSLEGADYKSELDRKKNLKVKIEHILNMDDSIDPAKKNTLLRQVIEKVYYWKEKTDTKTGFSPFEIKIIYK